MSLDEIKIAEIISCVAPADKKKMLLSLPAASGYTVPSVFIPTENIKKEE